jgi:DNA-binding LacI/PurR family transcriptional regulator
MRMINYQPNSAARALATGRNKMIGIISFDLKTYGNARALQAIVARAQSHDYSVNVVTVKHSNEGDIANAFQRLRRQNVDGIIVNQAQVLDSFLSLPAGVPVVVVDGDVEHRYRGVQTDHGVGAAIAVRHLLDLGHETVWHLAGPNLSIPARRRAEAWLAALNEAGRPVPQVLYGDWTAESGYEVGREMARIPEMTAVFAANDQMALGLMRALHEAGRPVPGDVSIVGFDNIPESGYFLPPLTTIDQDFEAIGRESVELLLAQLAGTETPAESGVTTITPRIVVRASTTRPDQPPSDAAASGSASAN